MYGPHNAHDDVVYVQFGPSLERDDTRDMTDEEKKALGRAINKLNSVNLDRVVEIITEHLPRIDHDDDDTEIELDINSLDPSLLWALHGFVNSLPVKSVKKKRKPRAAAPPVPLRGAAAAAAAAEVLGNDDLLGVVFDAIRPAPLLLRQVSGVCRGWRDAGHRVIETALTNACGGGDHVVSVAVVHRTPIVEHLVSGDQSVPMARVTFAPTLKRTEVIERLGRAKLPEALQGIVRHKQWPLSSRGEAVVMEESELLRPGYTAAAPF